MRIGRRRAAPIALAALGAALIACGPPRRQALFTLHSWRVVRAPFWAREE